MKKGCPILRIAYFLARVLETNKNISPIKTLGVSVDDVRCMGTYCGIWDEERKCCGLITPTKREK